MRIPILLLAAALPAVLPACVSRSWPEKRRHVLPVARSGEAGTPLAGVLRVDRLRVSELYERQGFVYRTGGTTFEDDHYNEFFAPPAVLLRDGLIDWLSAGGAFADVLAGGDVGEPEWSLDVDVEEFYVDLRRGPPRAVVSLRAALIDRRERRAVLAWRRRFHGEAEASDRTADAVIAAWSAAAGRAFAALEADLRAHAGGG